MDVLTQIAEHHAALAELYRQLAARDDRRDHAGDRVLGLAEAATRLGVTRSWLSRRENYAKVGGFKGPSGRVAFTETRLRARLAEASKGQ